MEGQTVPDVEKLVVEGQRLRLKWSAERRHYLRKAESEPDRRDYWQGAALALTKCRGELMVSLRNAGIETSDDRPAQPKQEAA
jgi:hypothetical protein